MFFTEKGPSEISENVLRVNGASINTIGGDPISFQSSVTVAPTSNTKANQEYLLELNNGVIEEQFVIFWDPSELAILRQKTLANDLTEDKKNAWYKEFNFSTKVYEISLKYNPLYIISGILVFVICLIIVFYVPRRFKRRRQLTANS